jgi:spermidine synthase
VQKSGALETRCIKKLLIIIIIILKILDLENTLVVEIQKGILLYSCHIVRKFLNIDTEHKHKKVKMRRRDAGNYVDKHCTIT